MKRKGKIIKICIVFGLVVAMIGIPNIPAGDYPAYIDNLNAIIATSANELVEVQMNRWVGDDFNATIENWTLSELNEFLKKTDIVNSTFPDLEFIPGSRSADEIFTIMISCDVIENNSADLEAYHEAYPEYLESNASGTQIFTSFQQKGFIPQNKELSDLEEFLEDKYYEYEQDIEDWLEENCEDLEGETYVSYEDCIIRGKIGGNIKYYKWPYLMKGALYVQRLDSGNGCNLEIIHPFYHNIFVDSDLITMINSIWIGFFVLPIHMGFNPLQRICFGYAYVTELYDWE